MNWRHVLVAVSATLSLSTRADVIVDWSARANATIIAEGPATSGNPIAISRTLAIMHLSMLQAINACGPGSGQRSTTLPPVEEVCSEAAAHSAARTVLEALHPNQQDLVEKYYADAMALMLEKSGTAAGVAIGEEAARLLISQRKEDGTFGRPDTYRPFTSPGTYVPTGLPVVSNVASRVPFALRTVFQFRPGPPPSLDSGIWSRDFNETKTWGGIKSSYRSEWQTETARFWEQIGPPAWNQVARQLFLGRSVPIRESARIFALLNIAMFDAYLAVFDAKYHYNFWRPITAIRNGDQDGNDATVRDPAWRPLIDTPPHPEYPCAHCAADGAAGTILKSAFGSDTVPLFKLTFVSMPAVTHEYSSIDQMQREIFMARIWGGVHYRNSNEVGEALGTNVGEYVLKAALTTKFVPLQARTSR